MLPPYLGRPKDDDVDTPVADKDDKYGVGAVEKLLVAELKVLLALRPVRFAFIPST